MTPGEVPAAAQRSIMWEGPVLADSSVWIDYYRPDGRGWVRDELRAALADDRVATSAMVLIEVVRGAPTPGSYQELQSDFSALRWLDVSPAIARDAARIGSDLERAGKRVPATDLMIAAAAISHGHTVWHDDAHFEVIAEHSGLAQRRFAGR